MECAIDDFDHENVIHSTPQLDNDRLLGHHFPQRSLLTMAKLHLFFVNLFCKQAAGRKDREASVLQELIIQMH